MSPPAGKRDLSSVSSPSYERSAPDVTADQGTLNFGGDGSDQFAPLSESGSFDAFTSRKIFEETDSGILASLQATQ